MVATTTLFHPMSKTTTQSYYPFSKILTSFISSSTQFYIMPSQVLSIATTAESTSRFDEMVAGSQRKYYMLGGKGGVGKRSCAASLAVKFASHGHSTMVVSTDPAHSLSDSFAQDLTGGNLVLVQGVDSPLYALELNPEKAREELRSTSLKTGASNVKELMNGMGFGKLADQVVQLVESQEYSMFTRIVFDTAVGANNNFPYLLESMRSNNKNDSNTHTSQTRREQFLTWKTFSI